MALAWALKELCYEAWHGQPARAARAAGFLQQLAEAMREEAGHGQAQALADWTAGIAAISRGALPQAVQQLDAAAAGLRAAGQADAAAQTQVPKVMLLSMLGRVDEAAACALAALAELRACGNTRAAARMSQNLGNLRMTQDHYAEAARHFREAAVLFARQGEPVQSVLADIGWAIALAWQGDFDEARRIFARARMRAAARALERQLALVDELEAVLELGCGRYREALAGFESARRRQEALGVPQDLAVSEKQLADAYLELHLLPEALALYDQAAARFRELGLPLPLARTLAQRGRALALLGDAVAPAAFAEAAALFEQQGNAVGGAQVALARAGLALAGGDAAAALALAQAAATEFEQARQADGAMRAALLQADALLALGQLAVAEERFAAARAQARERAQRAAELHALSGLGCTALAAGHAEQAAPLLDEALEGLGDLRRALPGDELRSAFQADHLRPYEARLRVALQRGDPAEVLVQLDRLRGRVLDERLAEGPGLALDDAARALRERLDWLYRQREQQADQGGAPRGARDDEIRRVEAELLERVRRQRLAAAPSAGPRAAGGLLDVPALCAALAEGDAVVVYGVVDDALHACVATRAGVQLRRALAAWPEVLQAAQALQFQIDTLRHGSAGLQPHLPVLTARAQARLQRLHALLWQPLVPLLAGVQRVGLVPHGPLAAVPFHALDDGGQAPLGARHQLALLPSARAACRGLAAGAARPLPRRALAVGDSSRLPHAGREAAFVASLFDAGRALVGPEATVAALQRQAAGMDLLHLACHAEFRRDNPRFSALHLADAALTLHEAEALPLAGCTVVLSACESGVSAGMAGDELLGLGRAFLAAGAPRVVASLWPVDDAVTAAFMGCFYAALAGGQGPAVALQQAQAATRAEHPHPCFWGAFTLFGGV